MNSSSSPSQCDLCSTTQSLSLIIHNVRSRFHNRRFCTNCVLKQHPGTFCPICFELFDDSISPHHRLMCVRCPAVAHRSCVFSSATPPPPFKCPTCLHPNLTFFNPPNPKTGAIDAQSAKVLVTAARIAAVSMSKAAAAARSEAERCAREACLAKKRAKEALETLLEIVAKEKEGHKEQQKGRASGAGRLHVA
ncbi:hypothetical protein RJT34_32414 [Clitoria ternatea]|uniref:RING-type domain-containing protein n=1 Tax=Clitoria ternatea TaxID=43366 RepID=A0AAN9I299_CLITE